MAVNFKISELRNIAEQLTEKVDIPFDQMTHSFLKRRLNDVFDRHGFKKSKQLIDSLNNKLFCDDLCLFFSVNITELFRDASFWRHLRTVISERYNGIPFHIWLPDLSSGEELYSLLILLNEIDFAGNVQITVNHPSAKTIDSVKSGKILAQKMDINAYNYKRFEGVKSIEDYYQENRNGFEFNRALLDQVVYQQANMLKRPNDLVDLILFRNSMLYYTKEYHVKLKSNFDKALKSGGFICLGVKEVLPAPYDDRFECVERKEKVYCKYSFIKE